MTGIPDALLAEQHGSQEKQGLQHAQGYAQVDPAHPPLPAPGCHSFWHYLRARLPDCLQSHPLRQLYTSQRLFSACFSAGFGEQINAGYGGLLMLP